MRVPLRSVATLLFAVAVATCADAPTSSPRTTGPVAVSGRGRLALSPVFSTSAKYAAAHMADFGITFDHVRIIITRPPAEVVKDTTIAFTPGTAEFALDLTIDVKFAGETFNVTVEYLNSGASVFRGDGTVASYAPGTTPPAPGEVTIHYSGLGATVTRLAVTPKTVALVAPGVTTIAAATFDVNNNAVASPVAWTSSDPTVATVTPLGTSATVTTTGKRGTVTITATTPTLATDNAAVAISLPPSAIVLVSGGGQSGKVGAALAQPGVVAVRASDGVGIPGVTVNFAAPAGGKVGAASVVTNGNGQASTSLTLGGTVGPQSFAAVYAGFSTAIPATATVGDPASLVAVSGGGQLDTLKKTLKAPLIVKVTDSFGNPVSGVAINWAKSGGGSLSATATATGADGTSSVSYTLGSVPATETITATSPAVAGGSATFTVTAVAGAPSAIAIVSGSGQTGRVNEALANPLVVKVTDDVGNGVAGATVTWGATNGSVGAASTVTDATGQTSTTLKLGTVVGSASATASVAGKTVTFSATVQAGIVAQLVFKVNPPNGTTGAPLAPAIQVALQDAGGNATAATNAVTLAIGTNPGSAVLGGTLTIAAVNGTATFSNLTLDKIGTGYTLVASSAGVPNATSAAFNVVAGGAPGAKTWTGAVSGDWTVAGNWSGGVPGPADDVVIPGDLRFAFLPSSQTVNNLTVSPGGTIELGNSVLTVNGNLDASGSINVGDGSGSVYLAGVGKTLRGNVPKLGIGRSPTTISINGTTIVSGALNVGPGSGLLIGAFTLTATTISSQGQLTIQSGAAVTTNQLNISGGAGAFSQTGGSITVNGDATFAGASTSGYVTGGTLTVNGNFTQAATVSDLSFAASGSHRVVLGGAGPHALSFESPKGGAVFQDLQLSTSGTTTLATYVRVLGQLIAPAGARTVDGGGNPLGAEGGLNVDGLTLTNAQLAVFGGTIVKIDNVTFQGYSPAATPFMLSHPGAASPFTFNNIKFLVTPTTGSYLSVTDNASDANVLTITLLGSTPADGSSKTIVAGGAIVNWGSAGPRTWTGAISTEWALAGNWTGGVPTPADILVIIPTGAPRYPTLAAPTTVNNLRVDAGATLNTSDVGLTVTGSLDASGSITGLVGVTMTGPSNTLRGNLAGVTLSSGAVISLGGSLVMTGAMNVNSGGQLTLGGSSVTTGAMNVSGKLTIATGASVTSTSLNVNSAAGVFSQTGGVYTVNGNATFAGGSTAGGITGGQLIVTGNFLQTNVASTQSFAASAGHRTTITPGLPGQIISFASAFSGSSFGDLEIAGSGSLTMSTSASASGQLIATGAATRTVFGGGAQLNVAGLNVDKLVLDNVRLTSSGGTIAKFDNVTFQGYSPTVTAFTVNHVGAASPFVFNNTSFLVAPTSGFYISAQDLNPSDGTVFTVNLISSSPADGSARTTVSGGAVVNWGLGGSKTWAGTVSTDWSIAGNWSGGVLPAAADNVTIPSGTPNSPALTSGVTINNLTVAAGATISLGVSRLTVNGDLDVVGTMTSPDGFLRLNGTGKTVKGSLPFLEVSGDYSISGSTILSGGIQIFPSGKLTVVGVTASLGGVDNQGRLTIGAGAAVTMGSIATTGASGVFSQTGGVVTIVGNASFAGASTTGLITGGQLIVGANFSQSSAVSTSSFVATGTHRVTLNGAAAHSVVFVSPAASGFRDLELTGAGQVNVNTPITVAGQLISPAAFTPLVAGDNTILAGGLDVDGLVLDHTLLTSTGGTITKFDNVTFQGYAATAIPLTITHPGAAAAFTFNNIKFLVTPTTGAYLNVTDNAPADGNVLTINLTGSTPPDGSSQTATAGGAIVHWGAAPPVVNAWTNPSGGNWSNPANWSLGRIPIATDSVVIALGGTYTVTLDIDFSGTWLAVGGSIGSGTQTLSLTSRSLALSIATTTRPSGQIVANNSGLVGADFINQGTLSLLSSNAGQAIANTGTIITGGPVQLFSTLAMNAGSILRLNVSSSPFFSTTTVGNGFTNNGLIELTSSCSCSATLNVSLGTLVNGAAGTITSLAGGGGSRAINADIDNQGTITTAAALAFSRNNASLMNSGTINLTTGDLSVTGGTSTMTNVGTLSIAPGRSFSMGSGTFNRAGIINGGGTVSLSGMTLNLNADFNTGSAGLSLPNTVVNGPGKILNAAGKTLSFFATTIAASSGLINDGIVTSDAATNINGPFTANTGSMLRVSAAGSPFFSTLTFANGFTNNGAIELTSACSCSATLAVNAGTLVNAAPSGTITTLAGAGGGRTIAAAIDNQNTITTAADVSFNRNSTSYSNSGTINLTTGNLSFGGTAPVVTNTGTLTIGPGRTLTLTGGTLNANAGGSIGGTGTLVLSSSTANLGADMSNSVTALVLSSSTLNGPGKLTNAGGKTLTLFSTTVAASSGLINDGLLISDAATNINGSFATNPGSMLRVSSAGSPFFSTLTIANGFTNSGAIELTSGCSCSSALVVTSGVLVNALSTGTITTLVGGGGGRTITAAIDNQNTITTAADVTFNRNSSTYINTGTINLTIGNVSFGGTAPVLTNAGTLTIGAGRSLTLTSGTLNENPGATIGGAGTLILAGSTANLGADIDNGTTALVLSSATINGPGKLTNASGKTLTMFSTTIAATSAMINNGLLISDAGTNINGPLTANGGSLLRVSAAGSPFFSTLTIANGFINNGAIELTSGCSCSAALVVTAGTIVNPVGSTITTLAGAGGGRTITAAIDNQGTLTTGVDLLLNRNSTTYTNSGVINLTGGNLSFSGTAPVLTNTGTLTIGPGRTLTLTGGTLNANAGGSIGGTGTLVLSSSTANLGADLSNAVTALVLNNSTVNGPGKLANASGKTLTLFATTVAASSAVINDGLLISDAGTNIDGPFTANTGSTLRIASGGSPFFSTLTIANGFTNNGLIELTSGCSCSATLAVTAGTLINAAPSGSISILAGAGGGRTITAAIDNQSTITTAADVSWNRNATTYTNSGTINLTTGNLTLSGTSPVVTNTGILTIGAGRTMTLTSGTLNANAGGSVGGTGTLVLASSTANLGVDASNATTTLVLSSATINGPGKLTNVAGKTLTLFSTTIAATSALINDGLLISDAATNINGPFTANAGSTLRVSPAGSPFFSTLTIANGFTNNGTIELTSGCSCSATLVVSAGTLVNPSGSSISPLPGAGGARTITAVINNGGLISLGTTLTLNRNSTTYLNSGSIELTGGDLSFTGTAPVLTNTGTILIGSSRTLTVTGGTLNANAGGIGGSGALVVSGSTLNLGADMSNGVTSISLPNSTVNGPGKINNVSGRTLALFATTIAASSALINDGIVISDAATNINGPFTANPGSTLRVAPVGSPFFSTLTIANGFTNNGLIELTSGCSCSATLIVTTGTLVNALPSGSISILPGSGGGRTITAVVDNQHVWSIGAPLSLNRGSTTYTNGGTIDVTGGDLTISGSAPTFVNNGTLTIGASRTVSIGSGTFTANAVGSIGGTGTLSLANSTGNFATDFSNLTTAIVLSSATINGPGKIVNEAGKTLTLFGTTIAATSGVINNGILVSDATTSIHGPFTANTGSTLRVSPAGSPFFSTLTIANGFTNNGAIELTSGCSCSATLIVTTGTLINAAPGGTISTIAGAGGSRTIQAALNNQSLIAVGQALTLDRASTTYLNSGTINLIGGDVTFGGTAPALTNTGTISIPAPPRQMLFNSGTFNANAGGSFTGTGTLVISSSTVNLGVDFGTPGVFGFSGSTINGPGKIAPTGSGVASLTGSTVAASSGVVNNSTVVANANNTINGAFTSNAGSILRVTVAGSPFTATLTMANGFTNNGTINLTSTCNCPTALTISSGSLTNASAATIAALAGSGGSRTITGSVINNGTLDLFTGGAGTLSIAGAFTNGASGQVNMELGGLTAGTQYDRLAITGNASLGGTLNVGTFGGFTPLSKDQFDVMTWSSFTGDFTTYTLPGGAATWVEARGTGGLRLTKN